MGRILPKAVAVALVAMASCLAASASQAPIVDGPCKVDMPPQWTVSGMTATAPDGSRAIIEQTVKPSQFVNLLKARPSYTSSVQAGAGHTIVVLSKNMAPTEVHGISDSPPNSDLACHIEIKPANSVGEAVSIAHRIRRP